MALIVVALAVVAVFVAREDRRQEAETVGVRVPKPAALTMERAGAPGSFVAADEAPLPRLLDLGSTTCIQCKKMIPVLDELEADYAGRLTIEFIDVKVDKEAVAHYGIRLIPTQIFFAADGSELFRHEGFIERETILAKWAELGVELGGAE